MREITITVEWKILEYDEWAGLVEVEYEPDNKASIRSAVVRYIDKSKGELTRLAGVLY